MENTSLATGSAMGLVIALVAVAVAFVTMFLWRWFRGREERRLSSDIAEGRYSNALSFFLKKGRYVDAGAMEEARGNLDRAAEYYERGGELSRAGAMYAAKGEHGLAAMVYRDAGMPHEAGRSFMFEEKYESAIPLFEAAEDYLKVAECWDRLDRPKDAAKAYEQGHGYEQAASIWAELGDLVKAAELYRRAGKSQKAAKAFWRSGDIQSAADSLKEAEEWVTLGRLWTENGDTLRAIEALALVEEADPQFRQAWILKAQLEEKLGDAKASLGSHQILFQYDVEHALRDDHTRRWILSMAQYHFRNYDYEVGLNMLGRLDEMELMTPELARRVATLRDSIAAERGDESRALIESLEVPSTERYEIIHEIGRGGNGAIFRARDRSLDRIVAVKLVHRTSLTNQRALEWFMREAKTAAQLNHPNIVTIYDLGALESQPYLAMELVEGETLVQYIERTKELPLPDALLRKIVDGLVSALGYAHEAGVVHLDIKLENVMLSSRGEVKLMDFGLARAFKNASESSVVSGTPLYMAPEQIRGGRLDHRTDMYAFGVMLYLLMTGSWPVGRERPLYEHLYEIPTDPREHRPELSPGVATMVMSCLAKEPDDRPDSILKVAEAFSEMPAA